MSPVQEKPGAALATSVCPMTTGLFAARHILRGSQRTIPVALALLCLCVCLPARANAQSSLTDELTEPGKIDVSFDFLGSVARRRAGGFEWYLPGVSFGFKGGLEIGGAVSTMVPPTADEPREAIPHARWQWLETSRHQTAVIGAAWHAPLSNRSDAEHYGLIDLIVSQPLGQREATTVSAGVYTLVGRRRFDDTRHGVILGWDHTLSQRWSYSVEWTSGNNWYGYLSPSVTLTSGSHWMTAGYCIGNQPSANHGPCISAGRTF